MRRSALGKYSRLAQQRGGEAHEPGAVPQAGEERRPDRLWPRVRERFEAQQEHGERGAQGHAGDEEPDSS